MNQLSAADRVKIVSCLVEGNSLRATTRMTGIHRTTVMKLLEDLGNACTEFQDEKLRNLSCKRIQCDEIWAFVGCKEKNVPTKQRRMGRGDVWTWVAIDPETKLIPSWYVGNRDYEAAYHFIHDLAGRLSNRVQLTTDAHRPYLQAVEEAFGEEIDYAQLVKIYGAPSQTGPEMRYSPAVCLGTRKDWVSGTPKHAYVSTSICERNNLTMRMGMRRFTRLTNAFSKKIDNLKHSVSIHFMHYNFCRVHGSLRVTPAMEAGIADHVWSLEEVIRLLDSKNEI